MKYVNASEILPKELISEIQKYVEGNIIYIPNKEGKRVGVSACKRYRDEEVHSTAR